MVFVLAAAPGEATWPVWEFPWLGLAWPGQDWAWLGLAAMRAHPTWPAWLWLGQPGYGLASLAVSAGGVDTRLQASKGVVEN